MGRPTLEESMEEASPQERMRGPAPGFGEPVERQELPRVFYIDTFTVFRPYQGCKRCLTEIEAQTIQLPDNSDYVCKHTRVTEYTKLMNRLRNPHAGSGPWLVERKEWSNDRGEAYVMLQWEEKGAPSAVRPKAKRNLLPTL